MSELHFPDEDIDQHFFIGADPSMDIPHGVHVFVVKTRRALRRLRQESEGGDQRNVSAWSYSYDKPDDDDSIGLIVLSSEELELSLVVHEVTHVALHYYGNTLKPHARASAHIGNHSETLPLMIGNLSAMIWWNLTGTEVKHD